MNYSRSKTAFTLLPLGTALLIALNTQAKEPVRGVLTPLPAHSIQFEGGLEDCLQTPLVHWNKGVVPYAEFVEMFRTGRKHFAQGEMWGKAMRSGSMFYRYTQDPELKEILRKTCTASITGRRVYEASCPEEPGAGKLHAGTSEGGAGQPAFLPRHRVEQANNVAGRPCAAAQ